MTQEAEKVMVAAVEADPRYAPLVAQRARIGWLLSAVIFLAFTGYLALIAFDKPLLGRPIGDGVTSLGIPLGIGLILLGILLTGVYVGWANRRFDAQMAAILADHRA